MIHTRWLLGVVAVLLCVSLVRGQRQMESLDRGLVALPQANGHVYLSWRLLGTDPSEIGFNVYRMVGSPDISGAVRLNSSPVTATTDFTDTTADPSRSSSYFVRPVLAGVELPSSRPTAIPANAPVRPYLALPLTPPPAGSNQDGPYTYAANDASAGDLDGDGEFEIVLKWDPSNAKDNAFSGTTGNVYIDAYKLDGTRLWRIDLGRNIRAGAHYTQFLVYDFDGDGKAEMICKTGDGTVDGTGTVIGDPNADWRETSGFVPTSDRTGSSTDANGNMVAALAGRILRGPEYLTVFAGPTGKALATANYSPPLGSSRLWGDDYANRSERYLACVAYLDGSRPSAVMCRGYYARTTLAAWDWRDGQLTRRWLFDSDAPGGNTSYRGQGNHNLSVADVDNDTRDEIIYGSCAFDDDGRPLYTTRLGHGDAMHASDLDPERPGLEVWQCHEPVGSNGGKGLSFRDAASGTVLWTVPATSDTGRALSIDIDPRHPGSECWGSVGGLYNAKGAQIGTQKPSSINFAIWWDADPLREILDGNRITKWNWGDNTETRLLTADNCTSNNGSKSTPCLTADLLGDWREEVVFRTNDSSELRIYTTNIPAADRLYTLMHDPQYRLAVAWQNAAYNQPPHPGFHLGNGMTRPPTPLIRTTPASGSQPTPSRLINLSVLAPAGQGDDTLIVGFGVAGGSRSFLVRGIGPTLSQFQVANPLSDPELKLFASAGTVLSTNNDWSTGADVDTVLATAVSVGAFPLPRPSRDSALVAALASGTYSVHVGAASGTHGPALVELYSVGESAPANLNNVSVRARVSGNAGAGPLITGFVVRGPSPRTVLIRAVGPQLASYGVAGTLADPHLTLFRGSAPLSQNDNWSRDSGVIASSLAALGAFPLANGSKDAALLVNLPEGNYSVHTSSADGGSGIVLVEVYTLAD